jgi:hypothetical protein
LGKAIKSDNHQQLIHQIVIEILTMTIKEQLLQEIEKVPEPLLQEVLDFIQFLQNKRQQEKLEITLLSESSLQKDWLKPEEEAAWQDL